MIKTKPSVEIQALSEQGNLEISNIYNEKWLSNKIMEAGVQKPGLALTGFIKYFNKGQIQLFGRTEVGYLMQLEEEKREKCLKNYLGLKVPGIMVSENQEISDTIVSMATKYRTPILVSRLRTPLLISRIAAFIYKGFAKKIKINGVLMNIMGLGILITGASGIGKSETALELINDGHQLISDDLVEFYLNSNDEPMGRSMDKIKKWLEVRGLGIINVVDLFGIGAYREEQKLDLVINLEKWNPKKKYDRLGEDNIYFKILGKEIPMFKLPVASGRNVSTLIAAAVKYYLSRKSGSISFIDRIYGKK